MSKHYDSVITAFAGLGAASIGIICILIVAEVGSRALGIYMPSGTDTLSELTLLFSTMLAAPWMVRNSGHVYVETLLALLPGNGRLWVNKVIYAFAILISAVVTYFALKLASDAFVRGDVSVKTIDVPSWLPFAAVAFGFGLSGVEFLRFLVGKRSYYSKNEVKA
ncbi:Small permease component (TRAP transporter) BbdB2 (plasmid) [Aminobacter sp. MSH1]|uniref:TRAP transporter small permease n=1 Tax=Aminobacter sp. MSH1 TaxID=374606 RepID=UPI0009DC7362|nr:TRAP transporter small permease [Aminobacter sp. MSH1]ARD70008.1 Small permease component (TRAP transporter) BbdB2 [Aminobacter sp. MSH1]